ncbi:hypothetical protein IJ670_07630 [bacterium]|nr:hypothetical protein [bacterium]
MKYAKNYNVILDNMDLIRYRLRPIAAITYIQDAFARYMATRKLAAYDLFSKNMYWVVGEFNMEFMDELPFWSEEIRAEIWISELSKLKIYTDFEISYKNKPFTKGNACWFIIDGNSKRPVKTDEFHNQLIVQEDLVLGNHKKFNLPDVKEKINEIEHKTNLSDLDFNNHVNNKSYINLAELTATEDFKRNHILERLDIRFIRETFLGDVLNCVTYSTEENNVFAHKITKDDVSVCEILTKWKEHKDTTDIVKYPLEIKKEITL